MSELLTNEGMESLSYYTTCTNCDEEGNTETILEGVGLYHRESNTLYLLPCIACNYEMEVSGWLDECEKCGELHYDSEDC